MSKTLVKTIGAALLTTAIALTPSCIATYPLGTKDPEMQYEWVDKENYFGGKIKANHTALKTKPELRESYERNTGKTFVP